MLIQVPKRVKLLSVVQDVADHANQEEDLAIEAAVSQGFENIAKVPLVKFKEEIVIDVAEVLDVLFSDGKRVEEHVKTAVLALLAA